MEASVSQPLVPVPQEGRRRCGSKAQRFARRRDEWTSICQDRERCPRWCTGVEPEAVGNLAGIERAATATT